jgi:hypothetical protein
MIVIKDSPVELERKELPQGDLNWPVVITFMHR